MQRKESHGSGLMYDVAGLMPAAKSIGIAAGRLNKRTMQVNKMLLTTAMLILISALAFTQELNQSIQDANRNEVVLIDFIDRSGLQSGDFAPHYEREYHAYQADYEIIQTLKESMSEITITIILASWCGDTKMQLPRFLKILDEMGFREENLVMIGVDSNKQALELEVDVFDIKRVPTFIVFRNEIEIGRIVERPHRSLETDLLHILR